MAVARRQLPVHRPLPAECGALYAGGRPHLPRSLRLGAAAPAPTANTAICRSGLVSRKARTVGPAMSAAKLKIWGRSATLSRHKAAPTPTAYPIGHRLALKPTIHPPRLKSFPPPPI
ncbi:hypothetical protein CXQ80_01305 [Pseudomonas sp. 02C 26]|nr:hypothetical protein CXQ80_01305 [Pseudomonas sp. 02C 26]